jgi:t-SNARE complex subunit (syntaxin)
MRLTRSGHLRQDIIDLGRNVYDSQKMHRAELTKEVEHQVALRLQESGRGGHTTQAQAHDIAQALVRTGRERQIFQMALQELRDAVDERQRVDELEQSCEELFLLLKDFQRMVVSQADLIEAVHRNVQKGLEDARRGEADLRIAKKESKTCCAIM